MPNDEEEQDRMDIVGLSFLTTGLVHSLTALADTPHVRESGQNWRTSN